MYNKRKWKRKGDRMPDIAMTKSDSLIQVTWTGSVLVVDFPFNRKIIDQIKTIDGADWSNRIDKKWTLPKEKYKDLMKKFGKQILWKTPEELKEDSNELKIKEEELSDVLDRIPNKVDTSFMKLDPYDFQKVAVGWAVTKKGKRGNMYGGLLADLMGLGKTIEALAISGHLKHVEKKVSRCLVICPATLKTQWGQEINKFTNEKSIIIDGSQAKRSEQFEKAKKEDIFYTIINYELLYQRERKGKDKKGKIIFGDYLDLNDILKVDYDMVIIDEAHRMKNPDTKTAEAIRQIDPEYRLLMTGTPIEKDLQNIFQLMDYLNPNILTSNEYDFETRRKMFEDRYLIMGWNQFAYPRKVLEVKGVKNVGLLKKMIAPYMLRRTTEDVSDELPDRSEHNVTVGWETHQKKLYDKLSDDLLSARDKMAKAEKEEERERYENEMNALLMYLLEVCDTPELLVMSESPTAKKRLGKRKHFPKPPKLERLVEMVEELTIENKEKVVIFSKFERMTQVLKREIEAMYKKKKSKNKVMMYTGTTPKTCKWKKEIEKAGEDASGSLDCLTCPFQTACSSRTKSAYHFQNTEETKVIIATDAGNYGVNLQAAKYLINYDLPDIYATYDQRNARIRRLGSKHDHVTIYNLVTSGGIDESKYDKLMKQKEIIERVVEKTEDEEEAVIRITKSLEKQLIDDIAKKKKNST